MPFLARLLGYSLAGAMACFIFWRFGPQRLHWHVLAVFISFVAAVALGFDWKSLAGRITFNSVDALALMWGVFGLASRSKWPTRSRRST